LAKQGKIVRNTDVFSSQDVPLAGLAVSQSQEMTSGNILDMHYGQPSLKTKR
jgi:hypothetical protein